MTGGMAITVFVIALLAAIMLHELGHLLTARWSGMKADRYFLGFGPTLWSTQRGETEYGVKAFPLGGFVRICGMSPLDEKDPSIMDAVFPVGVGAAEDRWEALEAELRRRGTPKETSDHIVRRTRATVETDPAPLAPRDVLREVIITEVEDTRRVGDLRHRLLEGDRGRFFHDRPPWQRAIVLVSGSVTHFALAFAVLLLAYAFLPQWTGGFEATVSEVIEGSPADEAGLEPGDRVLQVEGLRSNDYEELRDAIRGRPGEPTSIVVRRDGEEHTLAMTPEVTEDPQTGETFGTVGFIPDLRQERYGPIEAFERALMGQPDPTVAHPGGLVPMFVGSIEAFINVFSPEGLGNIFAQATGQTERDAEGAVSLVGAASIAGQVADGAFGIMMFVALFAAVNVFIGIFNLVPLPPLDGGHLAVLGIERVVNAVRVKRGKPGDYTVDPRVFTAIALPVIVGLLFLMALLVWLDITDPIRF
jgi:regulator of sigma E protease